jgi:ABC-2 type transport system ATP-binding protein
MIVVDDLTKCYGKADAAAVDHVSFSIDAGDFVGYAGPNGAGKSTTIKMMTGILEPTSGTVLVDGLVPSRQRRELNQRTGVVFGQRTQLWWDLPLGESFELTRRMYGQDATEHARHRDRLVDLLALGPLMGAPVRTLSLGQRMRAELAVAVTPRPKVLFLDEPTIGLDIDAKAEVRRFLAELNTTDGTTILLTTHDVDDLVALCRRLMIIDHGRVISDGTVDDLRQRHGTVRQLVVDLAEADTIDIAGAQVVRQEDRKVWLQFSRDAITAPDLIAQVMAAHDIIDLSLEPPDLEDIIRRIYRGES